MLFFFFMPNLEIINFFISHKTHEAPKNRFDLNHILFKTLLHCGVQPLQIYIIIQPKTELSKTTLLTPCFHFSPKLYHNLVNTWSNFFPLTNNNYIILIFLEDHGQNRAFGIIKTM